MLRKPIIRGIILIFLLSSFIPIINGALENSISETTFEKTKQDKTSITCYTVNEKGFPLVQTSSVSHETAQFLLDKINELRNEIALNPNSIKTHQLQDEIIDIVKEYDLLQDDFSFKQIRKQIINKKTPLPLSNIKTFRTNSRASEWFCNFASVGEGSSLPVVILPRLIPIIVTPIPRVFMSWQAELGYTSCGGLLSGTGFIASGELNGFSLGFWGIGFSVFLPPMRAYGLFGYAMFVSVNADRIVDYPPNRKPELTNPNPPDGQQNIPISLSELSFTINDDDNDLMSYSVTTYPEIGGELGNNKRGGTYSIPVSGLKSSTTYTWSVGVSDGEDTTNKHYSFTTEYLSPVVTNPSPTGMYVSPDISDLQFTITDLQGDLMDYSVETSPNIGSKKDYDVVDGTYQVPVYGLIKNREYTWYLNVTDGVYWTREKYVFSTDEAELVAYWKFDEGSGTEFYDSSGNGHHGTISGGSFVDGISGTALSLDGINDYADATDFDINDDFSVSLWIKPESTRYKQCFIGKHKNNKDNILLIGYWGDDDDHGYTVIIRDERYRERELTKDWQHLVITGRKISNDQTSVIVYKNGDLLWEHKINSVVGNTLGKPWTIGQDWDSSGRTDFYNGLIDEIKVFNGILSEDEIQY